MNNEKGVWRTVGGRRIFIKDGQDLATAMKESGKFGTQKETSLNEEYFDLSDFKSNITKNNVQVAINMLPKHIRNICKGTKIKVGDVNKYSPKDDIIYIRSDSDSYTILHEIGHVLDKKMNIFNDNEFISAISEKYQKYKFSDFELKKYQNNIQLYVLKDNNEFVSQYQTTLYTSKIPFDKKGNVKITFAREYFSEGLKYYFYDRKLLKSKDIKLFNYIKKMLGDKNE